MSDEEFECQKCHSLVELGDGLIPTKYCNLCAQELVEEFEKQQSDAREGMVPAAELRDFIQAWKKELDNQWAMRNFTGFVIANDARFARLETLLGEKESK